MLIGEGPWLFRRTTPIPAPTSAARAGSAGSKEFICAWRPPRECRASSSLPRTGCCGRRLAATPVVPVTVASMDPVPTRSRLFLGISVASSKIRRRRWPAAAWQATQRLSRTPRRPSRTHGMVVQTVSRSRVVRWPSWTRRTRRCSRSVPLCDRDVRVPLFGWVNFGQKNFRLCSAHTASLRSAGLISPATSHSASISLVLRALLR